MAIGWSGVRNNSGNRGCYGSAELSEPGEVTEWSLSDGLGFVVLRMTMGSVTATNSVFRGLEVEQHGLFGEAHTLSDSRVTDLGSRESLRIVCGER